MCLTIWGKRFLLHRKWLYFSNIVFGEFRFPQKSLTKRKKQPLTISRQVLVQQTLKKTMLLLQAPAVPEKKTNILEEAARNDRGSPGQNVNPISDFLNAL